MNRSGYAKTDSTSYTILLIQYTYRGESGSTVTQANIHKWNLILCNFIQHIYIYI